MPKIVLIGSECSGKTSLAQALAKELQIDFLDEYSREYAEEKNSELGDADVLPIAKGQLKAEQEFISKSKDELLLFDTCLFSTYIYSKIYYNKVPKALLKQLDLSIYDYFFLTFPDPQWVKDGVRNMPMSRMEMHRVFKNELRSFNLSFMEIQGGIEERIQAVKVELKRLRFI